MSLLKNFFYILIFFLLSTNLLKAEDKVSYIDIDYVLTNTLAGKKLLNTLKKEEELKIDKFKTNDNKFKDEENKILAKRNLISKEEINKELKLLQVKFQKYRKEKSKEIDELKVKRNKNIINFLNLINPIIEKYMADNSIYILLDKKEIENLLPHRDPMLLIDELHDIKKLTSATGIVNVKKDSFFVQGHFPGQPVMPGVLIVEAFGQTAAALTAHGIDKSTYENKLVFLMGVEKARFRNPVIPDCKLLLKIEAIRSHGRVWKYKGEAFVDNKKMADAMWSATIVDKK